MQQCLVQAQPYASLSSQLLIVPIINMHYWMSMRSRQLYTGQEWGLTKQPWSIRDSLDKKKFISNKNHEWLV